MLVQGVAKHLDQSGCSFLVRRTFQNQLLEEIPPTVSFISTVSQLILPAGTFCSSLVDSESHRVVYPVQKRMVKEEKRRSTFILVYYV